MIINPQVRFHITGYIDSYFSTTNISSLQNLIQNYNGPSGIRESELRLIINQLIKEEYLQIIQDDYSDEGKILKLAKHSTKPLENTNATIVISRPRLTELGFLSIEKRNNFIETTECFRNLINSAKKILRICSPFLQKDVLTEGSFPDLRKLLVNAINHGVEIRVLTRELQKRSDEIKWLQELRSNKIMIVDYHLSDYHSIISSTHAKIICSDYQSAYIGSAELRKNSIITNFEIGCLLVGPQVYGICEAFDLMFDKGKLWRG